MSTLKHVIAKFTGATIIFREGKFVECGMNTECYLNQGRKAKC